MNKDNLLFIKQTLRYLGFGEALASNEQLEIEMKKGAFEFQLRTAACFDEWTTIEATLFFQKFDNFDTYFFSKYETLLYYPEGGSSGKRQTFYIKDGNGVTFKEAFNLLQGRSVYKTLLDSDGIKYSTWIQLSFYERTPDNKNYRVRQFGEHYGYDLEKALSVYPIRELEDDNLKMNLICSLQKGNLHPVTLVKANKVVKMFVAAYPEIKSLKIYSEAYGLLKKPSEKGEIGKRPQCKKTK